VLAGYIAAAAGRLARLVQRDVVLYADLSDFYDRRVVDSTTTSGGSGGVYEYDRYRDPAPCSDPAVYSW